MTPDHPYGQLDGDDVGKENSWITYLEDALLALDTQELLPLLPPAVREAVAEVRQLRSAEEMLDQLDPDRLHPGEPRPGDPDR